MGSDMPARGGEPTALPRPYGTMAGPPPLQFAVVPLKATAMCCIRDSEIESFLVSAELKGSTTSSPLCLSLRRQR